MLIKNNHEYWWKSDALLSSQTARLNQCHKSSSSKSKADSPSCGNDVMHGDDEHIYGSAQPNV